MARYLMSVFGPAEPTEFYGYPTREAMEESMAETGRFNDRLQEEGYFVFADGLAPATTATVVDGQGAEPVVTDGPYLESKEYLGGFWVIEAPDLDVALRLAAEGSKACRGAGRGPPLRSRREPRCVSPAAEAVARVHREEWARVVASLARRFGDLDLAEEMAAEAFAVALERWPADGVPPNPGGWITTTANRRAIDRLRRESRRDDKQQEAWMLQDDTPAAPLGAIDDDRLRLVFTCCHPALSTEARVALTLRLVGGLTVPQIASAFLVAEATIGQRITRAKAKIASARIPYRVPSAEDLPQRVAGVLTVLFLVFNEGYLSSDPDGAPVRSDLTLEALRLTRLVHALLPDDGEVTGLLALMLLTEARRPARLSATGELVTLDVQDRGAWDADLLAEGHALVRSRLAAVAAGDGPPGRFQLLAAINAVHTSVRDVRDTDWSQVVALYDRLVRLDPSPVVALNRAVALAELDGPEVALAVVDRLPLDGYHAFHATRADLLRRLGRSGEARAAYEAAIAASRNRAETAALVRRRDQLGPDVSGR